MFFSSLKYFDLFKMDLFNHFGSAPAQRQLSAHTQPAGLRFLTCAVCSLLLYVIWHRQHMVHY